MGERNKIIISYKNKETNSEIIQAKEEHAAAQVKSIEDYHKTKIQKKPAAATIRRNIAPSSLKHVTLSIFTALAVSLVLGFILLKVFVAATDGGAIAQSQMTQGAPSASEQGQPASLEIPDLSVNVIQSGVFSTEEKAQEWKENLAEQSIPSLIWEKDGQFFLLSGSEDLSSGINEVSEGYSAKDIPVYKKEWTISGGKAGVSKDQSQVVQTIIGHLEARTLHSVPQGERAKLLQAYEQSKDPAPGFLEALKEWNSGENNGISWLSFAKAINSMKN
ncbi:hypothetical protein [Halobacillus massiliensis]|uniref:hypothetical protein n=1 Tax=Halobacillus massiliensis TaxID=1926286 RepID=UPI0009E1E69A|nr:hypothetical protein [Halobacillus massiliensis]